MLTADTNCRGYAVIPLTDLGLDDLTTWLRLSNTCYTDTHVTDVEYLGVIITSDAEHRSNEKPEMSINSAEDPKLKQAYQKQLCCEANSVNITQLKSEVSQSLSYVTSTSSNEYPVIEHDQWGTDPNSSVHKENIDISSERRSSRTKEISELEKMKRSVLSKSFLNLRRRDFFSRSMTHVAVPKNNKGERRSQSAKDLLFQRNYSGQSILFTSQQIRIENTSHEDDDTLNSDKVSVAAGTGVVDLPTDCNGHGKHEHDNIAARTCLNSSDPGFEHDYNKECQIRNPRKSVSGDSIAISTHTEHYNDFTGVHNKNYLFHPLDRLFKRRSNTRKRRKIKQFSLTMFLCGCSKRSFR